MRLLHTNAQGEIEFTCDFAEEDVPPYAILSHTWGIDEEEVSFEDIRNRCGRDKPGFKKIDFCAKQARRDNLEYFWVDTCCIDRTNSVELQEAIISMFRWYHGSKRCYVHLADVSLLVDNHAADGEEAVSLTADDWEQEFRKSRWFTRGWTLQELLAPPEVEFFSAEGRLLGTKKTLVSILHSVSRIPLTVLNGASLSRISIVERFRWTRTRKTKKPEDKAYCLIGLFDISIPLIYGEGQKAAMYRLGRAIKEKFGAPKRSGSEADAAKDISQKG